MRHHSLLLAATVGLALLGTSCRNLRTLTAKDHSSSQAKTAKGKRDPRFLNDISASGSATTAQRTANLPRPTATKIENTFFVTSVNVEQMDPLQLKYAIRLDATVERVLNLPLLQQLDYWWGTRYCLGGNTTNCVDCSGFTAAVLKDVYKASLPRTSQEQYNKSERVAMADLKEGDLVFFAQSGGAVSHVGIYLTNNKFVHASTSQGVMISDLNDAYWAARFYGAGRLPATVAAN